MPGRDLGCAGACQPPRRTLTAVRPSRSFSPLLKARVPPSLALAPRTGLLGTSSEDRPGSRSSAQRARAVRPTRVHPWGKKSFCSILEKYYIVVFLCTGSSAVGPVVSTVDYRWRIACRK